MKFIKTIYCSLFASMALLCSQAQTVLKDKKRGAESFAITIRNKPYKQFIPTYLLQHASYRQWQQKAQTACQTAAKGQLQTAKIKLLVSVNHLGKVFVSDHYSSPSLTEWVDDPALAKLVERMADDLQQLIIRQGKVKPPYNKNRKQYYNDETVVELEWRYMCR